MAFNMQKLENHAGSGGGLKLFSYHAGDDNRAAVNGAGYFNEAASLLSVGDRIAVHATDFDYDCHVSAISADDVVTVAALDDFA